MAGPPFIIPGSVPRLPADVASKVNAVGDDILKYFNPDMDINARVTKGWQYSDLDEMIIVAGAYVVFVLFSYLFLKPSAAPKTQQSGGNKGGKAPVQSVAAKFAKEPILVLQAVYNLAQVALCGYMIWGTVTEYQKKNYSFICNPFNSAETGMAGMLWVFYVSKILDFFDTIFMVVRGKWVQFSFLHVYHHTSIFMIYWLNINVGYDGDIYYTVILNAFIHFMMYLYYFLRTFNVAVPTAMKKFVTNSQLIQFVTMMGQAVYILGIGCPFPNRITGMYLGYIMTLFYLFSDFKKKTYVDKKKN
jgi:elongation of very long chain fatty acids protein 4